MKTEDGYSIISRWRRWLNAVFGSLPGWFASKRLERRREELGEEAQRCEELLDLRGRLRNRLRARPEK